MKKVMTFTMKRDQHVKQDKGLLKEWIFSKKSKTSEKLSLSDSTSDTESEGECPMCGLVYGEDDDDGSTWIHCDACKAWWDLPCTGVSESDIPDFFSCPNCIS